MLVLVARACRERPEAPFVSGGGHEQRVSAVRPPLPTPLGDVPPRPPLPAPCLTTQLPPCLAHPNSLRGAQTARDYSFRHTERLNRGSLDGARRHQPIPFQQPDGLLLEKVGHNRYAVPDRGRRPHHQKPGLAYPPLGSKTSRGNAAPNLTGRKGDVEEVGTNDGAIEEVGSSV